MNQHIQNIIVVTDIIFTAALVLYFSLKSIQNLKEEYKDKWLTAMNGFGSKDWYTEKGWAYVRKVFFVFIFGGAILVLILILSWISGKL